MDSNHSFLWSEFENQTKTVFHNLISDTDFLDVTLVTDDEKQIKAHKVILSSSSSFFRKILSSNQHQHPLLYLKGISSSSLGSILQFIYLGEVNVSLEHLDSFIQASEDLKIVGMLDSDQEKKSAQNICYQRAKRPRVDITEMNISQQSDDLAQIQEIIDIEHESETVEISVGGQEDDDFLEVIHQPNDKEITEEPEILFCDKCEFETINPPDYEEHVKNDHANDIPCKECKFSAKNKSVLKDHMLASHKGIPCNNCHKRFSDLTFLRKHVIDTPDCRANILK